MVGKYPIHIELKTISSDTDIDMASNKQFTNARIHGSDKLLRKTRSKKAKLNLLDNPTFSPLQTKQAIADSKPSRALGPDGLCKFQHKLSTSYRPISLLCPAVKVLERLIHPFFNKVSPYRHTSTWFPSFPLYHYCAFHIGLFLSQTVLIKIAPPPSALFSQRLTSRRLLTWCVIVLS